MFNFLQNLFSTPEEREMRRMKATIEAQGGAACVVAATNLAFLVKGHKGKITQGNLSREDFLIDPAVLGVASIHCMMDARKKLKFNSKDPEASKELEEAEEMFLCSVLMQSEKADYLDSAAIADRLITKKLSNPYTVSEDDVRNEFALAAQEANDKRLSEAKIKLQKWRDFDCDEFTPFVKIIIEER